MNLPQNMTALRLETFSGLSGLKVKTLPLPELDADEILLKVLASPINPSDGLFCEGLYQVPVTFPVTPGFEGAGVVVATGSSFLARRLMGQHVASATQAGDGFWAEYVKVKATQAMKFDPSKISPELASMSFVNPLSALALIEPVTDGMHRAMVQTAAASQLGQMVLRLAQKYGLTVIHCVHREELRDKLLSQGAKFVLNTSDKDFSEKLRDLAALHKATYAIDAVGGVLTGQLADAMPKHSTITVYGALSQQAVQIDPGAFIFKDQKIEGFWLGHALSKKSPLGRAMFFLKVKSLLQTELTSHVARKIPLKELPSIAKEGLGKASTGKNLIVP